MQRTEYSELFVGIFVLTGIAVLLWLAIVVNQQSLWISSETYSVSTHFTNAGNLKTGAPVKMSGVRIGRVADIQFDDSAYQANVIMSIEDKYQKIPEDSLAKIYTTGLLGEQFISIEPGGSGKMLSSGDRLLMSQSAMQLEEMIGQMLYNDGEQKNALDF